MIRTVDVETSVTFRLGERIEYAIMAQIARVRSQRSISACSTTELSNRATPSLCVVEAEVGGAEITQFSCEEQLNTMESAGKRRKIADDHSSAPEDEEPAKAEPEDEKRLKEIFKNITTSIVDIMTADVELPEDFESEKVPKSALEQGLLNCAFHCVSETFLIQIKTQK